MRSLPSRGFAVLFLLGLFAAVACGSDDDSSGALGTAGAGRSGSAGTGGAHAGTAGTGGAHAGTAGQGGAGAREDLAAGAGGVAGFSGGMSDGPVSYPCAGPSNADGSAGQGGEAGQSSAALSCTTGDTFCYVRAGIPYPGKPRVYVPQCAGFTDSLAKKCATTPSCDCFCSVFQCETECRCNETNGFATVTCDQI